MERGLAGKLLEYPFDALKVQWMNVEMEMGAGKLTVCWLQTIPFDNGFYRKNRFYHEL